MLGLCRFYGRSMWDLCQVYVGSMSGLCLPRVYVGSRSSLHLFQVDFASLRVKRASIDVNLVSTQRRKIAKKVSIIKHLKLKCTLNCSSIVSIYKCTLLILHYHILCAQLHQSCLYVKENPAHLVMEACNLIFRPGT